MSELTLQMWRRALAFWLLLWAAEFVHGIWRMKVLAIWVGDFPARQVCVSAGSLLILFVTYVCTRGFLLPRHRRFSL